MILHVSDMNHVSRIRNDITTMTTSTRHDQMQKVVAEGKLGMEWSRSAILIDMNHLRCKSLSPDITMLRRRKRMMI